MTHANLVGKEVNITKILDAPRELVYKAWIDERQLSEWWGPEGFTNPVCKVTAGVGGTMYIEMKAPDGTIYPMNATFIELHEPEKIVLVCRALDENGNAIFEVQNTITLEEHSGRTKLIFNARVTAVMGDAAQYIQGMEQGWTQSLVRLSSFVQAMAVQ